MDLEHATLQTLKYSSVFNYPLSAKEIYKYLICTNSFSYAKVKDTLEELSKSNKIYSYKNIYSLTKIGLQDYKSKKQSLRKYKLINKKVKKELNFFNNLFFIKFVGLTGSTAAKDLRGEYDVDLFFITQKNFVWITRFIAVLFFKFNRIYKNPYCPNIYISCSNLTWQDKNVYVANEIARLKIIYNKQNTYQKFLQKNKWVGEYLNNFTYYIPKTNFNFTVPLYTKLFYPIELLFFGIEYLYMKPKISSERVSLNKIMFLKKDYKSKILSKYKS